MYNLLREHLLMKKEDLNEMSKQMKEEIETRPVTG